jgi:hypothetical protein
MGVRLRLVATSWLVLLVWIVFLLFAYCGSKWDSVDHADVQSCSCRTVAREMIPWTIVLAMVPAAVATVHWLVYWRQERDQRRYHYLQSMMQNNDV